jgi:HAT1-interacting factor 1
LAAEALDKELNPGSTSLTAQMPVNDLTSMVVKKKKKPVDETGTKRKADDEPDSPTEKKMKLDADA